MCVCVCVRVCVCVVKLATLVKGDPKTLFLIVTTQRCKGGCYFFPIPPWYIPYQPANCQVGRAFAKGLGDLGSIPSRIIPKTLKMVLDTSLLNTQQYKVRIKGKVEQSRERSRRNWKKEPSGHPRLRLPTLLTYLIIQSVKQRGIK